MTFSAFADTRAWSASDICCLESPCDLPSEAKVAPALRISALISSGCMSCACTSFYSQLSGDVHNDK